ncbi:hypothetical protein [Thermomonas fusca]
MRLPPAFRVLLLGIAFAPVFGCNRAAHDAPAATSGTGTAPARAITHRETAVDPCVRQRARAASGIAVPTDFPRDILPAAGYRLHQVERSPTARTYRLTTTDRPAAAVFDEAYARIPRQGWTLSVATRGNADAPSTLVVERTPRKVALSFTDQGCGVVAVELRERR